MIITYQGKEVDFNQVHSVSVEKDTLIFHSKGKDKKIKLGSEYSEVADDVASYIAHSYQNGFKKLNLAGYLLESEPSA